MTVAGHLLAAVAVVVGSTLAAAALAATAPAASPTSVAAPAVPAATSAASSPVTTTQAAALPASAFEVLAALPVRDRDPVGYTAAKRVALFGPAWADVDHNGCDTRNDVLRRDLHDVALQPGTHPCVVVSGTLHDPYTGHDIPYRRGVGTSTAVQIDHVVSLGDTYRSGANGWTPDQRRTFANNPANLLAVSGPVNESKGDDTADEWTPPDPTFGCRYAGIVVAVKTHPLPDVAPLSVSVPERDALAALLKACPDQPAKAAA